MQGPSYNKLIWQFQVFYFQISLFGSSKSFTFKLVETRLIVAKKFLTIPKEDRVAPKNSLNKINSEEKPRDIYKRLK